MESLYFVAVVPPQDIREQITEMKRYCAQEYGSKHALRSPPHITLHMPFRLKDKKITPLCEKLDMAIATRSAFEVVLQDFDFFAPRVIFVDVQPNEHLKELQKQIAGEMRKLQLFNATHKDNPFHPHVTVAFRDLRKKVFPQAQEHFAQESYQARWQVDHIVLLKHDHHKWTEFERLYFPNVTS